MISAGEVIIFYRSEENYPEKLAGNVQEKKLKPLAFYYFCSSKSKGLMYAIVDIETTGGHAHANGITEIAIIIHDGVNIVDRFETLLNPRVPIPPFIQNLTGINEEMVKNAPCFDVVANQVYELLKDKVFVAHNVNFDYSFLKYHLSLSGFDLQCKKLCTVRLGRKIMPGLPSYSLGKLCHHLGISNSSRHRAMGDAAATAIFFGMLLSRDTENHIGISMLPRSKEQYLPTFLPAGIIEQLPSEPGVYYFHNLQGKVIYVGKAKNLKKRVNSHFTGNNPSKQRQNFLRNIHNITYQLCGTELIAFILEAVEIKRLWPAYNRSLKRFEQAYGLFLFEDQKGYYRLAIDKRRKHSSPVYTFGSILEGHNLLQKLIADFELCQKLCFIQRNNDSCQGIADKSCRGACEGQESPAIYNTRVLETISHLKSHAPTFAILAEGRYIHEQSCILMEAGQFYGMGYVNAESGWNDLQLLKQQLTPYPANEYIHNLMLQHLSKFPDKSIWFTNP
jgi:DNA polymerase-3 subunit epsilon